MIDRDAKFVKILKCAIEVTQERLRNSEIEGQVEAISKVQAVIEFKMDGTFITANRNFFSAFGYSHEEIHGKHYGIFLDRSDRNSQSYCDFWASLNKDQYQTGG